MSLDYLKVRLKKDDKHGGGFHERTTNVEASIARHWASQNRCQIVDDKPAKAETVKPAQAEEVQAQPKTTKKSASKD